MSIDLINIVKNSLSSDVVSKLSNQFGETPDNTRRAMAAGVPAVLSGMISKIRTPGGVQSLLSLFSSQHAGLLDNVGAQISGSNGTALMDSGKSILTGLFGGKVGEIAEAVSSASGVRPSSATSALAVAGPLLMGAITQAGGPGRMTVDSLPRLLNSQREAVVAALPAGLFRLSGLGSIGASGNAATELGRSIGASTTSAGEIPKWIVPAVILALLAIAGWAWFTMQGTSNPVKQVASQVSDTASATAGAASDAAGKVGAGVGTAANAAWASLGDLFKRKLSNGVELNVPKAGVENRLIDFIEDSSKPVDKTTWFDFDRLLFKTGEATLEPVSKEQLANVAAILKAYPKVHLKIGGYTDNVGSAAANLKLSEERAQALVDELVLEGVDKSRLTAKGYGAEHPVADNATEEGRQKNRRNSVIVTQK